MLSEFGRRYLSRSIGETTARLIARLGVSPNQLTILGLISALTSAISFANGRFILGGVFLLVSGTFDILDGELAKTMKRVTSWGIYLDSVIDRYSDTLVLLGLAWYYTQRKEVVYVILVILVIVGALLVSYTKARAESIVKNFSCGLMQRPERIALLAIGAFSGAMRVVLWVLVFLVHLTAIQRIIYSYKRIKTERGA